MALVMATQEELELVVHCSRMRCMENRGKSGYYHLVQYYIHILLQICFGNVLTFSSRVANGMRQGGEIE